MDGSIIYAGFTLFVGLAVGALAVLLIDGKYWGQREHRVVGERNKAQALIQVLQARLQRAEKNHLIAQNDIEDLRKDIEENNIQLQKYETELQLVQAQLQTAINDKEQLTTNLVLMNEQVDEWRGERGRLRPFHEPAARWHYHQSWHKYPPAEDKQWLPYRHWLPDNSGRRQSRRDSCPVTDAPVLNRTARLSVSAHQPA